MIISDGNRLALEEALRECFPNQSGTTIRESLVFAEKTIDHRELLERVKGVDLNT